VVTTKDKLTELPLLDLLGSKSEREDQSVVVVVVRGSLRSIRRRFSSREEDDLSSSFCNAGAGAPSHHALRIHTWSVVRNDKHEDEGFSTILFEPQSCKHRRQVAVVVIVDRRVVSRDSFDLMVGDI